MKKAFNKIEVRNTINELFHKGIEIFEEDIYKGKAIKKLRKDLEDISYINILYNFLTDENDKIELIKRFFPKKYEEVKDCFTTNGFYYNEDDDKIYWTVSHDGNDRTFKLKTDMYLDRTVEERKKVFFTVKNKLDKLYGYWLDEEEENWYVTDLNKVNNVYKKIYGGSKDTLYTSRNRCYNRNDFVTI